MKKRILCAFLSLLMIVGTQMYFVSATEEETTTTTWTQAVFSAKSNNYWDERKNYSSVASGWDADAEIYYDRYVSTDKTSADNLASGTGSSLFYLGNWNIGNIPVGSLSDNKVYIGMYVRTNSASVAHYRPMKQVDQAGGTVSATSDRYAASEFSANGQWEFVTIELDFTDTGVYTFSHGQLRFETAQNCYIDIASWGIFATSVSTANAQTALASAATVADSGVHTVIIADRDGNAISETSLLNGKSVTLPDYEDTEESSFGGWTTVKGGYEKVAEGGAVYTPSDDITLYPIWVDFVRFVDGSAETNGNGFTPESPYNDFASAASDLAETGGTIVVMGTQDAVEATDETEAVEEVEDLTTFASLSNTGDIVITSVYGGVDYRDYGAKLSFSTPKFGFVDQPGKVTITDIFLVTANWNNWHLNGHPTEFTNSVSALLSDGTAASSIQVMALISASGDNLPDTYDTPIEFTVGKDNIARYYIGAREDVTVGDVDITIDAGGKLSNVYVSNNTSTSSDFGQLSIDGDITVTVDGTLSKFTVATNEVEGEGYGLNEFNGNISVIVNQTGTFTGTMDDPLKSKTNAWFVARTPEEATLVHGENGGDFVLTLDDGADYNFVTLTNETTSNTYPFFIDNGTASFTLTESGDYTMALTKNESKTVTLVDNDFSTSVDPLTTIAGLSVTLPTLENNDTHLFAGWTSTEGGTSAEFEGGESFTVSDDTTLYAVWQQAQTYTVYFMVDGVEFYTFTGMEGKTIEYPTEYPEKDEYYFKGWDSTPELIGTEDIVINAVFVSKADYGEVVYVDGSASENGNGTIGSPMSSFTEAAKAVAEGGTVVVIGKTTPAYSGDIKNTGEVIITSLDPITGKSFMAEITDGTVGTGYVSGGTLENGGYIDQEKTCFFGNGTSAKIIFRDIIISQSKYNCLSNAGNPIEIGENVVFHRKDSTTYMALSSAYTTVSPFEIYATFKSAVNGAIFLSHTYVGTLSSVNIDFYEPVSTFNINANNGEDSAVTLNGPMKLTVYEGASGTKFASASDRFAVGASAWLSIIRNNATTTGSLPTQLSEKTYDITVAENGILTHTGTKGAYGVASDTYNYAQLVDAQGSVVDEAIIVGGAQLKAPGYGTYTVAFSNKEIYSATYVTTPFDELAPAAYAVTSDDTSNHTIVLPVLESQISHKFLGWATSEEATEAEFAAEAEYTLAGEVIFYAVWEEIPQTTVTFKDDDGNVLHTVTDYVGAPLTFPESNPYKYGEKLLGYAYEGTQTVLTENDTVPSGDKTALPVWGDIPANETRLYVNADGGSDDNDGISPENALGTIAAAVAKIKTSGGYIIVTGGTNTLTGDWNNSGDITLTSLDPVSGISYKATTLSGDGLSFADGASVVYGAMNFGYESIEGKITLDNLALVNSGNYQFVNFNGHPYEAGKGIEVYQQTDAGSEIVAASLYIRSLGESGSTKTPEDGIHITVNTVSPGAVLKMLGKADNEIPGVNLTVNSTYNGDLQFGNDSGAGIATVTGDSRFTFNAGTAKAMSFQSSWTNPIKGNVYAIYNNGVSVNLSALEFDDGYGLYQIHSGEKATLSHGEAAGTFELALNEAYDYGFVKLLDSESVIVDYVEIADGKALITLPAIGVYTLDYTNTSYHKITFETGDDSIVIFESWHEDGSELELADGLYRYGWLFGGWTDGEDTYTDGLFTMPESNVTLTAIWNEATMHTIKFNANGADINVPEDVTEYINENIVLEKVKAEGATFIGWSEDPEATVGVLNHIISGDTTLYAITTTEPVYIIDSHFRGDPEDYTGDRCQFRRYVVDVYLENAVASSGAYKLDTDNEFLYYLGHVPVIGIDAEVTVQNNTGTVAGVPGLGYRFTKSIEFTWSSEEPVDATDGRRRVARIMLYFGVWGMGYSEIESRTTDEVVSPYAGYTALAGQDTALVTANFYKGVKGEEVKVTGKVTVEGREYGEAARYDYAKLYILDSEGDAVEFIVLEDESATGRTFNYSTSLIPGDYTIRVIKNGYAERNVPITVSAGGELPDVALFPGDTADYTGKGDGIVDIDDFIKILRGFSSEFDIESYMNVFDLNEDGIFNVADVAVVKNNMSIKVTDATVESAVDDGLKIADWRIELSDGNVIKVYGGSENAIENALEYLEEECKNGTGYTIPRNAGHFEDYEISEINIGTDSLADYSIVIAQGDEVAAEYAQYIHDYIAEISGFDLEIVYDSETTGGKEIVVGETARGENPITEAEKYKVYEENGSFRLFYGDEQSAEMACIDLCEKMLGRQSEGFDGESVVNVKNGQAFEGEWTVLTRYGVMSDTHVGEGKKWANYDWLHNTFDNFEKIHAENPLDFMVSLGDNIDDGYANTYSTDYATYLEEMKELDICDPVNPIDGRAEGMIPHYEICGNHDPIGGQTTEDGSLKIRFFKNKLWYTENEAGEKVAHIAFFTDYGGYPLYDVAYSGSTHSYRSYGIANDEMVAFVEESVVEANAQGAVHIILYNHYSIAQDAGGPVLPETGLKKIADVCEKYGIKLFFNGHEHNNPYTLRRYNDIYDYDCSMTCSRHSVVEITTLRAKVTIYNQDGTLYRTDIVPLSGRGEAKQTFAE